ncbi:MAG: glycosyltransferase [Phycisphaerae bacterium]|nr:glycosyltransferase family 4 protein [Phycisphaerae bacterium]NIR65787.1 glycosyltransferase family 4 protein [candidate division Zixibacteria bacterium]NIP51063.1 glycosyltransferase family 4 protein [Phycisphaerae bacterium]NIS52507.1 glycosyltransferase family 4 protein [Phycisphaerae bacterium]NIU10042.1 glycosyltransferase family 4 protein [Phycisphaerae bacterium]
MNEEQRESTSEAGADKPLRLALIVSEHTVLEYSISLERLLVGLADESIPVALVCPPSCNMDTVISGAVEVIRHPVIDLPLIGRINRKELVEQLIKFKPDIIHCMCESKAGLTKQIARQLDVPYVLTVNSLQQRWKNFVCQRQIHPLSISSNHCAKIIVPTKSIASNVAEIHPRFADRIEQINVGTFVGERSVCFCELSQVPSMVIAHPFDNVDDFENLFGAVRHLTIDRHEFVTILMGSGRAERQIRRLLAALGLLQTVTIVPRLRPWRSVVGAGDIFIQPAATAAFNPLLLEAMSVGAAVAGCKGGVDDLIIEEQTAVTFDPDDELSIYNSLKRLFGRRELARKIARGAQEYLRQNNTVSNMITSTLRTYRDAVQWYIE